MSAGKIAAIDRTAAMTTDGTIAGMTGAIIATTVVTTAATKQTRTQYSKTPACEPAFCFALRSVNIR